MNEAFNLTQLKSHGYSSMWELFFGNKVSELTPFDWRGVKNSTVQSTIQGNIMILLILGFVILDILEECRLYKHITDIVSSITLTSCKEKDKCTDTENIQPTEMYIAFAYPSMKFTFSIHDISPGESYYSFFFKLKKNIPCRLFLEDKNRFTIRPVTWKKEIIYDNQAEFEFSGNGNEKSKVYEFTLSIR